MEGGTERPVWSHVPRVRCSPACEQPSPAAAAAPSSSPSSSLDQQHRWVRSRQLHHQPLAAQHSLAHPHHQTPLADLRTSPEIQIPREQGGQQAGAGGVTGGNKRWMGLTWVAACSAVGRASCRSSFSASFSRCSSTSWASRSRAYAKVTVQGESSVRAALQIQFHA